MTRSRPGVRAERGAALVFVVLMVFGVFGLAAVVLDLGLARVTQASMQNAADVAAVEGLRLRDDVPGDASASDLARRLAAARAAALVYDDDTDLATANAELFLSLGPTHELVGGFGALDAGAQIVVGDALVPSLATNETNLVHGDLVAGTHVGGAAVEAADYTRTDFAVADADDAPSSPAFLARLRRTHDPLGLDAVPGVSTSAPGLPYVFGRGTTISSVDGSYDPRRDGITVRATAIADARRALSCGPPVDASPGLLTVGVALGEPLVLALDAAAWSDAACLADSFVVRVASSGVVTALAPGGPCDGATVGRVAALATARRVGALGPLDGVATSPGATATALAYLAVTRPLDDAAQVVAFGAVEVVSAVASGAVGGPTQLDLTLRRVGPVVAPANATALDRAARAALALDASLAAAHAASTSPLLAPVLVR